MNTVFVACLLVSYSLNCPLLPNLPKLLKEEMGDVHSKKTQSYNMSQIKGKNTKPELLVRKFLFANGFRYRLNQKDLPGKPDIVLKKYRRTIIGYSVIDLNGKS